MVMDTETPFRANVGAMGSQKYEAVDPVDLQTGSSRSHNYPPDYSHMSIPLSNLPVSPLSSRANTLHPDPALRYDPERAPGMPVSTGSGSWRKIEHSYQEFDPARDATEAHLAFADGDIPNNQACSFAAPLLVVTISLKASKLYNYLLNVSIVRTTTFFNLRCLIYRKVSRWIVFIVPVMVCSSSDALYYQFSNLYPSQYKGIIWIPGIIVLTSSKSSTLHEAQASFPLLAHCRC